MTTSLNDFSKNVKTFVPILILGLVVVALGAYMLGVGRSVGYSWRGVVPGETTTEEVKNKLGKPIEEGGISKSVQILKYSFKDEKVKIYIRDSKVILVKVKGDKIKQKESFNSTRTVFYSPGYDSFIILLYLDVGRGKIISEFNSVAVEDWYFVPNNKVDIKSTLGEIDKLGEERKVLF